MRRAAFITAVAGALVVASGGSGAPIPLDPPVPPVAIFYYAWYGTPSVDGAWLHWGQGDNAPPRKIGSNFYPARGPYSSAAGSVVRAQMREIAATFAAVEMTPDFHRGAEWLYATLARTPLAKETRATLPKARSLDEALAAFCATPPER